MKLRHIEIQGFKSFRDRTRVALSDGMTAIVGPNGCGKSNVVDALKWAMGDMSAKSLRGQTMEDLIFAGSESRRPLGLAEVTLTFENDGTLSAEDEALEWADSVPRELRQLSEIAVTRRLHRSGDSEYLINRTPCRLRDIQDLLAGTGVGKQGYSIIEQNRVGFIVSAKPSERRALIEEASGITRYQGQRDRAERKLERTEDNLERVGDVLREVEKQIRTLERQAKKAAQHRTLLSELRALDVALLLGRRDELDRESDEIRTQVEELGTKADLLRKIVADLQSQIEKHNVEAFAADKQHAEATEAFYRLDTRLNVAKSKIEHATVSIAEENRRLGAAEREAQAQATRLQELRRDLESIESRRQELDDIAERDVAMQQLDESLRQARTEEEGARSERESIRNAIEQSRAQITRAEDRKSLFTTRRSELELRASALQTAVEQAKGSADEHEASAAKVREQVEQLATRAEEAKRRRGELEVAQQNVTVASLEAESNLTAAKGRHADAQTRADALASVVEAHDGIGPLGAKILQIAAADDGVHGVLADWLDVPPEHQGFIANLLDGRLMDIVVDDVDVAHRLLDRVADEELDGRVVFQPLDGKTPDEFAAQILSRKADPRGRAVTGEGRLVAGTSSNRGVLEQRHQLTELQARVEREQSAVTQAQAAYEQAEEARRAAVQRADLARREVETLTLELQSRRQDLNHEERQLSGARRALQSAQAEIVPVLRARDELYAEAKANDASAKSAAEALQVAMRRQAHMGHRDADARAKVEDLQQRATAAKIALAEARERRRSVEEAHVRTVRGIEDAEALRKRHDEARVACSQKIVELQKTIDEGSSVTSGLQGERDTAREVADAARERLDAANAKVSALQAQMRDRRSALERQERDRQQLEFRARESATAVDHIDQQLLERFELDVDDARTLCAEVRVPRDQQRGQRDQLKRRIELIGPVNAMAEEEFEMASERREFLSSQIEDLESAIADLRQAISRMDRESRRRFKETFDAVNEKFQRVFPELFRGGRAELVLTDPEDLLTTGVEIVVQPPGKRLQSMSLLSGGEKALTAVSLIFSIFLLKPTPFSILDEVDAPLDEANVGRFAQMVKRLSGTSQMIVITHSRRTMESADMLYGVTMEEAGVSKLVNVRLNELDDRLAS